MFRKILIANRGEIALRVICACKELGIPTVAVYSEADRNSLHVRFADEAVCIGPPRSSESYLNIPHVISAAEITNVDAIHPGYGFLSENANFAEVCEASRITFIGPSPELIRLMGEKDRARREVAAAGLPIVPGSDGVVESEEAALKAAKKDWLSAHRQSVGRRRRTWHARRPQAERTRHRVRNRARRGAAGVRNARRLSRKVYRAPAAHRDSRCSATSIGRVIHLGERECSIQRRHQKLIEESPSPVMDEQDARRTGRARRGSLTKVGIHQRGYGRVPAR